MTTKLKNLSDIRRWFHRNQTPIYFVSATSFNLLGMDEWVRNFKYINYIDCFDGHHPNLFCPRELPHEVFASIEDINNYLLSHKDVVDMVRGRAARFGDACTAAHPAGKAVFLMFGSESEKLCSELGLEVCFPSAKLRQQVDDKLESTRIGDRAGVPSVPNVLARVDSYAKLREAASELGEELVVQTAFGDSGHTTFFISSEGDWNEHAEEISREAEVKVMKRIRCRGAAIEACTTHQGTIVGPLMTELVGFRELTPYKGGWCGNEVFPGAFTDEIRDSAREKTFRVGEELRALGYRGYFEIDFLTDLDSCELYMGEINPRLTGASSMTNLAAFAHADLPLFLFHLLEFSDVEWEIDVAEINQRWSSPENIDSWSQMVIKHVSDDIDIITQAPSSGIWRMKEDGSVEFVRIQSHRRTVEDESEAFFLRIARIGDYRYEGADLGILVTPGRLMSDDFELTQRAHRWINGIRSWFSGRPVALPPPEVHAVDASGFKLL